MPPQQWDLIAGDNLLAKNIDVGPSAPPIIEMDAAAPSVKPNKIAPK